MDNEEQLAKVTEINQYDQQADAFSKNQFESELNREMMYELVDNDLTGQHVLDLCCGNGIDAEHYRKLGAIKVTGLDESKKLLVIAQQKYPEVHFIAGKAEQLPFEDSSFDSVFSKYAIMTSADMDPIFHEIHRVLKPGGTMVILCTHPFRQYAEKGDTYRNEIGYINNYFEQKIVESQIFDGSVQLREPSHTMQEYFKDSVLSRFDLQKYREAFDPTAEKINGEIYPGFLIIRATKRLSSLNLNEISLERLLRHKISKLLEKLTFLR